ncbi:MAG: signal peptidase II [Clostridia bacterium]|nr:signal peptidase II [Clostridia bacterium]
MNKNLKRFIIVYLIFALLVVLDIITKIVTDGIDLTVIEGVLSFESAYNKGAAWSMFSEHTIILALTSLIFVIVAIVFDIKTKMKKTLLYNFAFTLILAGAFGNAIDRLFLGYVRDFIKLDFMNFPIFNVADCMLVVGVILLAIYILTYKEDEKVVEEKDTYKVDYINKIDESEEAMKMASTKHNVLKNFESNEIDVNKNKTDNGDS